MATKIRPLEETYTQDKYIRCDIRQKTKIVYGMWYG